MPKLSFTRASVAAATCPDSQAKAELFDTHLRSFGLEVRASGSKTFFVRYYDGYRRKRQFKIGDAKLLSVTDARDQARKVLRRVELGEDPRIERAEKHQTPTFEAFVRQTYLPFAKRHKRSWKTDESLLRNHILPTIGARRLGELQPSDFLDIQTRMLEAELAASTADRVLILCRYICNCAIRWNTPGIKTNPTAHVPLLNVDNTTQRYLSPEETQRLVVTLDRPRYRRLQPIVLLLLLTGARRGEVLKAQFDEFDLDQRIWRIPKSKSGHPRNVPLSRAAVELLRELQVSARGPFVCPNPRTQRPFRQVHYVWKRLLREADLPDLRMHDLRHSFASFMVNRGRSLYEVQRILGHHNIRITERYAHLSHESLLDAADTVGTVHTSAQQPPEDTAA